MRVAAQTIASNICGSDLHMYGGRTSFPAGMAFGHEITGEVVEVGSAVKTLKAGDWISVPFNISCGKCRSCKEQKTNACLTVNPKQPGGAYGSAKRNNRLYCASRDRNAWLLTHCALQLSN